MKNKLLTAFVIAVGFIGIAGFAMGQDSSGTIRLLYPQWQGGNISKSYPIGAHLLAWLAPAGAAPTVEVPVERYNGVPLPLEDGIVGRTAIMKQLREARSILDTHRPLRIVTFGGDCLVSQAPFSYLNERYDGRLGVLWIDAHPDVTTPKNFQNAHAMVLGNLLGEGDPGLAREVRRHIDPRLVMLAGVDNMHDYEWDVVNRLGLYRAGSAELSNSSAPVLDWIRKNDIRHLAIHFDLDVLDPVLFRSQLFNYPSGDPINPHSGKMSMQQVVRIITDAALQTDVVGFTIAEHMPWDDINLMDMMKAIPIMK